ncbi:MAG: hypothetical protein FOGNACKC_00849 [Anaerolineae bacterium]|nr:hypothetical protein [Anaerolineae bacterium]
MPDPVKLAQKHTLEELVAMEAKVSNDPANRNQVPGSIYLHTAKARKQLEVIRWAITYKLQERREARGETINEAGYTGPKRKRR